MYYGYDEYVKSTKNIIETTRYIERKYAFKDLYELIKNILYDVYRFLILYDKYRFF